MEARYFKIGVFVVVSVVLGVVMVIAFGGQDTGLRMTFETYLDESVTGLDVGSHVRLRGVRIGKVEHITLAYLDYGVKTDLLRVVFSCYPPIGRKARSEDEIQDRVREWVGKGLRVRLSSAGLTGGSYLELDRSRSDTPAPPIDLGWEPEYEYIPAEKSTREQFTEQAKSVLQSLDDANIGDIGKGLNELIAKLTEMVDTDLRKTLKNVEESTSGLPDTIRRLEVSIDERLIAKLETVLEDADKVINADIGPAAAHLNKTLEGLRPQIDLFMSDLNLALKEELRPALARINGTAEMLPGTVARVDEVIAKLNIFVRSEAYDISDAIRSLRGVLTDLKRLTESASRNPSGLILGGTPPKSRRDRGKR